MHASSFENMALCYERHVRGTPLECRACTVLDVGGADVNGSYRALFAAENFTCRVADIEAGPTVDIVLDTPYVFPLADASVDIVLSGQAFEHIEFFWHTFSEMARVVKPDGYIFLITPSGGPEHRYPVDCYRFYPDAYRALAKLGGCDVVELRRDERGPWQDLVGVFQRTGAPPIVRTTGAVARSTTPWNGPDGNAAEERQAGSVPYLDVLASFHRALVPTHYLEIGVRNGHSLALARGRATGVDPNPDLRVRLPSATRVVTSTSDAYFAAEHEGPAADFAFIDGLHQFEQVLRDFMHVERVAQPGSVLVVDDVLPNHPAQARRTRSTRTWTGDVWKLAEVLTRYREDLVVVPIDAHPTGLLMVAGLDPTNRVLWERYNPIVREFLEEREAPATVLQRTGAIDPRGSVFRSVLESLAVSARAGHAPTEVTRRLRHVLDASPGRPLLSVVIVSHDMHRELPRTIRSFSSEMQRGIAADAYELILVDNGSTQPLDEAALHGLASNLRIERLATPSPSPVSAIARGLELARGELVGVCIDGARLASPGLLGAAVRASALHPWPVIGTIGFHLGPDVQMQSVRTGYNQHAEDTLLASSGWEQDGYKLFEISVLAGSSSGGWFATPAESNAVFMRAAHWRALGGYDSRFVLPGGGLANLDLWARACADPRSELIMLLGEATFHQVHGGITTNSAESRWDLFHDEYVRLHGKPFQRPTRQAVFYGALSPSVAGSIRHSSETFAERANAAVVLNVSSEP